MEMKRILFIALLALQGLGALAQKAVQIESPIVSEKDALWYKEQRDLWKAKTMENPTDETAWRNYYKAARYMGWPLEDFSAAHQAIEEMSHAIPDTYTYNLCAFTAIKLGHGLGKDGDKYAEKALKMLPDDIPPADYNEWICYLAMKGQEERMAKMAKRYFESGTYSENVLRYSYNELAGMDNDGIFIANGDAAIIPKWLIQEGMGLFKDKTIVCAAFLAVKEYREWLNGKLNIKLPEWDDGGFDSYDAYERALLQAIIDRFGSKVYFSATTFPKTMEPWKESLYNEGLLLKYSSKPYDNLAVKRRNVENRYQLEYLLVPFRPEWTAAGRLSANYAVLLADLLPYYAIHDRNKQGRLTRLLVSGVQNTSLSEERKQEILSQLTLLP